MSLFNTNDDLGNAEEPVKSVEMEDISASEMDTAPCVNEDEPVEAMERERNSPIAEKMTEPMEEPNETEMETSNEMEVSPAEKEAEPKESTDDLIADSPPMAIQPEPELAGVNDAGDAPMEAEKFSAEDSEELPAENSEKPTSEEAEKSTAEESEKVTAEETEKPTSEESEKSTSEESENLASKESEKQVAEGSDSLAAEDLDKLPAESSEAEKPIFEAEADTLLAEAAKNIDEDSTSNQIGVIEGETRSTGDKDTECAEKDEDGESTGRASATNFATFDDESRMSNDKLSVDNVEDVDIPEGQADEVEEETTEAQEGEDPLMASAEDTNEPKLDAEEEILGAHSTHIPVAEDKIDGAKEKDKTSEESEKAIDSEKSSEVPKNETEEVDCSAEETNVEKVVSTENEFNELDISQQERCQQCNETKECTFIMKTRSDCDDKFYLCSKECCTNYSNRPKIKAVASLQLRNLVTEKAKDVSEVLEEPDLVRRCSGCKIEINLDTENKLSWQSMDFCSEVCIERFQNELGACCASCKGDVPPASMGKYCVRFGYDARQFCSSKCLEEFKKGLKVCSYCQRDISSEVDGFLAPLGDKGQFKDFCSKLCMDDYDIMVSNKPKPLIEDNCDVCSENKTIQIQVIQSSGVSRLCSGPCCAAFKFANNLTTDRCELCERQFDENLSGRQKVYYNDVLHNFCSKKCLNVHTLSTRKIVSCNWCKVKKYNFDMIATINAPGQVSLLCSLKCLQLYKVSVNASNSNTVKCDYCSKVSQGMYHLTMSDSTVRNFCAYNCCLNYQQRFNSTPLVDSNEPNVPVISSVTSLAPSSSTQTLQEAATPAPSSIASVGTATASGPGTTHIKIVQQTFVKPAPVKSVANKNTSCKPSVSSKGSQSKPQMCSKSCQTDEVEKKIEAVVPIPVPIYVPVPLAMYSFPVPMPVPFPLPIPVPMFIPTTRNSAKGIFKEIKRITDQVPRDPFEAELLMMAEMVAEDKKGNVTSESDDDDDRGNVDMGAPSPIQDSDDDARETNSPPAPPEPVVAPSFGGEDILQMAVNMAMEMTEPPPQSQSIDLETVLTPQPVVPIQPPPLSTLADDRNEPPQRSTRKRGRGRGAAASNNNWTSAKRTRTSSRDLTHIHNELPTHHEPSHHERSAPDDNDPAIEPDPDLQLKFTYGVLAFRKWIKEKNSELTLTGKAAKLFKTDILQLSTEELNFTLCMFVKEVRKPDGDEYAPDIIFYLCLGIQLYLYRSGRVDNIFTDAFYEKFTECLNQVSTKFVARLNDRTLLTRVEEEHLWESQQLGAHSPHVLLFTLMYFNTKYFYLTEVEDHMRLSFTHVMKHWKRNNTQPGKSGPSRNVLLRYYPPQAVLDADERKKKVYEQQENELNPLRCPVKLYEFYVSKCPESVRGRNDVFYLLPERSCVPDSPVWYSTMSMPKEAVGKMLNRIRMVREILCILHSLDYQ